MMKRVLLGFLLLISVFFFLFNNIKSVNSEDLAVYVNDELQDSIPKKGEAIFIKSVCDNDGKATWDNETWGLLITNMSKKTKCNLYFSSIPVIFNFDYTGGEQVFTAPVSGTYKLETWGAQGGNFRSETYGGYGGYSVGNIKLNLNDNIFINVGSTDLKQCDNTDKGSCKGGYNGGGNSHYSNNEKWGTGGGATHIATNSGLLATLENYKSYILIIAAGGGGAYSGLNGGNAGGYLGQNGSDREGFHTAIGGNQVAGGSGYAIGNFGTGGNCVDANCTGGGAGLYGGAGAYGINGAGGSGYIGNSLLKDKAMYCYNCEESSDESTKTISTTCSEETPMENCSKKGNGYARITLVSIDE